MLGQMTKFPSFLWLSGIPLYIGTTHLLCPFLCQWTLRWPPCPGRCKECCGQHWGARIFSNCGFLWVGNCCLKLLPNQSSFPWTPRGGPGANHWSWHLHLPLRRFTGEGTEAQRGAVPCGQMLAPICWPMLALPLWPHEPVKRLSSLQWSQ